MASFFIPLTGLESDSTALNTIANDLANMNTTGFKAQTTNFADLFYQQIGQQGSGDEIQLGAGVQVASNETNFGQGSFETTGVATDVALNGNGFFVVNNPGSATNEYTRDGNFTLNSSNNLITDSGQQVMGYPAVNGVVNTNSPITAINIPTSQAPSATTTLNMTANLDSTTATGGAFPAQITVYDSLGAPHVATVTYTQTATNTWSYSVALPAADFTSGISTPVTGTMVFNANGNLSTVAQGAGPATPVGTAVGDVSSIPLAFTGLKDGAANLAIGWNLMGSNGQSPSITQTDSASAVPASSQNGYQTGQEQGISITDNGTVNVQFSNGQTVAVGQLALANVQNLQGLQLLGDGDYGTTLASGSAAIAASGTSGLGSVQGGTLEGSNVNISAEFSDLIIAQRAFEANSKSVTTFDTVTQETINMVH
jgi:flagellar hook protein FlgE